MRVAALFLCAAALTGCGTAVGDEVARASAKSTVNAVLSERLPGVPLEPATDCVIDNASAEEILSLAADGGTGPDEGTATLVFEIAARPATVQCLATDGIAAFF